jgi:hypothetical protein
MLVFVALPTFLVLFTLVSVPVRFFPVQPHIPVVDEPPQENAGAESPGQRVIRMAGRLGSGTTQERLWNLLALARATESCPSYARYTVRRLVVGLEDADSNVRAATAAALGALGAHASDALPYLRATRGKGDAHADRVVAEAIWWVEHGEGAPEYGDCEPLPLSRPAGQGSVQE